MFEENIVNFKYLLFDINRMEKEEREEGLMKSNKCLRVILGIYLCYNYSSKIVC
ncbi:hypothetical protein SAMN02745883_02181 [Caminicella sporogenes DSM 14501]|uniref:Uncharacterized protein n=1 Tax=Caminicella sporogenes DSM 14501 TaxID=1121266 RepID=A0A1M6SXI6_9FIRM|nr:hypothetical protein [Caminicella sporogenes]SHK49367.1 hypothetical protein SAMN02745883_02181 [Caminicella sporogenes DSM 14501]